MSIVYIGVGGNLGDVIATIKAATISLEQVDSINEVLLSPLYGSKPLNDKDQPQYINGVFQLDTQLSPVKLLQVLQDIESKLGRKRTDEHWASRTLDLDILLYDDLQMSDEQLTIPHPGMLERDFVLYPLNDIAPALNIVGFGTLESALIACENRGLKKLSQ